MIVSEDGYVTGSIDVSKLDEVEPKSDEAKARLEALKAEAKASKEAADVAADRAAEVHAAQAAQLRGEPAKAEAAKGDQKQAEQKTGPDQDAETKALQAEAEAAGVTVDKRWGPDRLRQEIDAAKAAQARKR